MPVLSSTYSNYASPSSTSTLSRSTSGISSIIRPYSSNTSLSYKSRSSYNLNTYRPSSSVTSSLSNSYQLPSSSYSSFSSYSNRISGISSPPSSVTLTRYNQRRSSLDYNDGDISTSKVKSNIPISGLTNLGNTCYMNSVIQALYATRSLREYIKSNSEPGCANHYALARLFKDMESSRNDCITPTLFRSHFIQYQPKFRGYDQHDAQEFLRYLINGLHDEVNKAKRRPKTKYSEPNTARDAWNQYKNAIDDSKLIDLFVGQFSSVIKCTNCDNTSTCWDPFWDLSLPLPQNRSRSNIERCLKEFSSEEVLDYDEQPYCSCCKRQRRSTKRLTIQRSPPIMILHLKKFGNDGYKSSQDIEVNETLIIDGKTYSLYACVCHHGYSSRTGHYTAYCQYDSKWFHFNDDRVTDVTETFTASQLADAYVLFYHQPHDNINYSSRL